MNIAIPNPDFENEFQYIASVRFWNEHICCGVVISQDHVLVVPGCFYENDELLGGLHLYEVWIPIPYNGYPGRNFKIAGIELGIRFKHDIAVLLVSSYTKN